jgi:hypothetical protein
VRFARNFWALKVKFLGEAVISKPCFVENNVNTAEKTTNSDVQNHQQKLNNNEYSVIYIEYSI